MLRGRLRWEEMRRTGGGRAEGAQDGRTGRSEDGGVAARRSEVLYLVMLEHRGPRSGRAGGRSDDGRTGRSEDGGVAARRSEVLYLVMLEHRGPRSGRAGRSEDGRAGRAQDGRTGRSEDGGVAARRSEVLDLVILEHRGPRSGRAGRAEDARRMGAPDARRTAALPLAAPRSLIWSCWNTVDLGASANRTVEVRWLSGPLSVREPKRTLSVRESRTPAVKRSSGVRGSYIPPLK